MFKITPPSFSEWDTSKLDPRRRKYLDSGMSFDEIVQRVVSRIEITEVSIKPYCRPDRGEPEDARQVIFVIRVEPKTCDLVYNAPDGLRGRYWQSPDDGFLATRQIIDGVLHDLISFAERNPPEPIGKAAPMNRCDIRVSLTCPSAKVWPYEKGTSFLTNYYELKVKRWFDISASETAMWRRTPTDGQFEIKGAIVGTDHTEYIPKKDRSCQIHRCGFT